MNNKKADIFGSFINEDRLIKKNHWSKIIKEKNGYKCANADKLPNLDHSLFILNSHHIIPKYLGGKDTLKNGIVFCRACHAAQHPEYYSFFRDISRSVNRFLFKFLKIFNIETNFKYYQILEFLTGYNHFRPRQLEAIKTIFEKKKHLFVVMPTGSGKSIVFQIPSILKFFKNKKTTVVLEPLNALQKDQVSHLLERWVMATYINSELSKDELDKRIEDLLSNNFIFLYLHPKQLLSYNQEDESLNLKKHKKILNIDIDYLVVDECHVIERFGLSFVKEYFYLKEIYEHYKKPQIILLTATASKKTREFIKSNLNIPDNKIGEIVTGFYRPEIELQTFTVYSFNQRNSLLKRLIENKPEGKTIIFCTTTKQVDEVYNYLKNFFDVVKYHSKLEQKEKDLFSKKFQGKIFNQEVDIMVATSAYGMGIDIPNVHQIIHYSLPFSLTDYYQQIGRAGRDGKKSVCQLIHLNTESTYFVDFINEKTLEAEKNQEIKTLLTHIFDQEKQALLNYLTKKNNDERWQFILDYFGDKKPRNNFFIILVILYLIGLLISIITSSF